MIRRLAHPLGEVQVTRKGIRHLYLRLDAESGALRVNAPRRISDAEVLAFIDDRAHWIERQRARQAERPPIFGATTLPDTIHLLGRAHALERVTCPDLPAGRARVTLDADRVRIHCGSDDPQLARQTAHLALREHCRGLLREQLERRVEPWARAMGLATPIHRIRRMRTRWGTCNIRDRRIWLNLELARMPVEVIDLVVVHELAHLIERGHNRRFYAVMDDAYPDWRRWEPTLSEYGIIGL
ncbi:SprT family zinc-dependent metalloprotease [Guyparkeria sp. GHLCS8-2]|uniref:M48 family metallopeptidase n=1 Tax=Guyparkeria halopsychrophila TaxID=3139421 RepID=UPI0037CA6FB3